VVEAAMKSGVARIQLDLDEYRASLEKRLALEVAAEDAEPELACACK